MTSILLALDKFKGSLAASEVCAALARGITSRLPEATVRSIPVADGGDGTLEAAIAAGFEPVSTRASGPLGDPISARYARRDGTAIIELAEVSGLAQLPGGVLRPLEATSRGVGDLIRAAVESGCRDVVLGLGGSACSDGGAGLLQALGARLLDDGGAEIGPGARELARLASVELSGLLPELAELRFTLACDVDNPLTGPSGAAAVFGPQKGLSPDDVAFVDDVLTRWADLLAAASGVEVRNAPGAGAAGGVGFAVMATVDVSVRVGIELVLDLVGFADLLPTADIVVVGEGSLDEQSLHGKAPIGVAAAARRKGIDVVAVCGRRLLTQERLEEAGIARTYALTDIEDDAQLCMTNAAQLLERVGARLAEDLAG